MSERAPLPVEMLDTYRCLALRTLTADHFVWKLFGYIDWLETTGYIDWLEAKESAE